MARIPNRRKAAAQALEKADRPIYLLDESRRIIYCNEACIRWLGVSDEQLLGQRLDYLANPSGDLVPWGGLCPPPQLFCGEATAGTGEVWISPDQLGLQSYRAQFLALSSVGGSGGVLVAIDCQLERDETTASAVPSKDSVQLHEQLLRYAAEVTSPLRIDPLVGNSAAIKLARAQVRLAAQHADRVLIVGPRGAGHELVARSIHKGHRRGAKSRLFPLDCTLLDAELLQTTVAAFIRRTAELAEEGAATLLLLDVDHLTLAAQATLLEIINSKAYALRTIATASPGLPPPSAFRHDLAAALSTLTIYLPALSERLEDLPLLIQSVLESGNCQGQRQVAGVGPETFDQLVNYPWRGNLDELVDVLREARDASQSTMLSVPDLPAQIRLSAEAERLPAVCPETIQLDSYLNMIERELIGRALRAAGGNRAQAARLLGISRARLLRRIEALGPEMSS